MFMKTKTSKSLIASLLAVSTALVGCTTSVPAPVTPAQELISRLESAVAQNKIMVGHQDATSYGHSWKYEADRSDVRDIVGDYPAVMGWDLGDIEFEGDEDNLDGVPFEFIKQEIIKQDARGGVNTISWHAYNPVEGSAWTEGTGMVTSILPGGANYDMYQERLGRVADFLSSLRDAEGNLIPIIFRPWHEHDGNWFWWGEKWCTHEEYRQLWDMTYNFMQQRELVNLVWCYMPVFDAEDKTPAVEQFDMVGFDEYPHGGKMDVYKEKFQKKLDMLKYYGEKYNKLITVSETGNETMLESDWFTATVLPLIEGEGVSYVLFWRNAWDKPTHFFCSYKGHESEADFKAFVENESIITAKEIAEIK